MAEYARAKPFGRRLPLGFGIAYLGKQLVILALQLWDQIELTSQLHHRLF